MPPESQPTIPLATLIGSWQLSEIVKGAAIIAVLDPKAPYTLVFNTEGNASGKVACNRWRGKISLDGNNVVSMQMIAADENLKDRLPRSRWDENLGYFVMKNNLGNARRGVSYTRGLKPLRPQAEKHSFEAKLCFMTMPDQYICQQ